MKLIKAEIAGFGKWQSKIILFQNGNQLFFGLNEEGKSTIYHFIATMLFGFSTKNKKKNDYAPKNGGAFGGKLWIQHPDYGEILIERYKNKNRGKARILYQETQGDDVLLAKLLSPLTEEIFSTIFTLNQEQLNDFHQLEEKQLHEALMTLGVSGSTALFQLRQDFNLEAQKIYKHRGFKQPLIQKLKEWPKLDGRIQEKREEEAQFGQLSQKQEGLTTEIDPTSTKRTN